MESQKKIKKLIKNYKDWCNLTNNDRLREMTESELKKQVKSNAPRATEVAALQLHHLAGWYGNFGVRSVLDNNEMGWELLEKSFYYKWYYFRIDRKHSFKVQEPALVLTEAIARGLDDEADWVAQCQLQDLFSDLPSKLWEICPFAIFALELWAKLRNQPAILTTTNKIKVSKKFAFSLDMYRTIFENWENESELRMLLTEACEYHLSQSITDIGYAEFYFVPYNLLPVDILAVNAVRQKFGQDEINLVHPLMTTKLSKISTTPRFDLTKDELLQSVINKAKNVGLL